MPSTQDALNGVQERTGKEGEREVNMSISSLSITPSPSASMKYFSLYSTGSTVTL